MYTALGALLVTFPREVHKLRIPDGNLVTEMQASLGHGRAIEKQRTIFTDILDFANVAGDPYQAVLIVDVIVIKKIDVATGRSTDPQGIFE